MLPLRRSSLLGGVTTSEVWQLTANLRYRVAPASPSATMDAVVYEAHGEVREALRVDHARAQPATTVPPGFVVIRVAAAALNPVDFKQLRNLPDWCVARKHACDAM